MDSLEYRLVSLCSFFIFFLTCVQKIIRIVSMKHLGVKTRAQCPSPLAVGRTTSERPRLCFRKSIIKLNCLLYKNTLYTTPACEKNWTRLASLRGIFLFCHKPALSWPRNYRYSQSKRKEVAYTHCF